MKENEKTSALDSFDHVVVLMLENRSFDNLLGYLYPEVPKNAPLGKSFEGLSNIHFTNPVPKGADQPKDGSGEVAAHKHPDDADLYFKPFPDPGEEYWHVNTQLFNKAVGDGDKSPYNLPKATNVMDPSMKGFLDDYIAVWKKTFGTKASYDNYKQMMGCFTPDQVPVLSTLAKEFAVFDRWFCSVPSQTWCNRAYWNAGTSWGHTINGPSLSWATGSGQTTLFNQIEDSGWDSPLNWKIYSDNSAALTSIIHAWALSTYHIPEHFPSWDDFHDDCKKGKLPAYTFIEPKFWTPHNDMHPSTYNSKHYGESNVGSVLLGEKLVADVYNSIKSSDSKTGNNSQNTLLIITFDEHGGCFDHYSPTKAVVNPDGKNSDQGFDFTRLGVRVPMIMVSANIAKNTIVNDIKDHTSFAATMRQKWDKVCPGKFPPLTERSKNAADFTEVFTSLNAPRPSTDWPDVTAPTIPAGFENLDFSGEPLNDLQQSMLNGASALHKEYQPDKWKDHSKIKTVGGAEAYLKSIPLGFGAPQSDEKPGDQNDSKPENKPEPLDKPKTFWEKVIEFFKNLFGSKP